MNASSICLADFKDSFVNGPTFSIRYNYILSLPLSHVSKAATGMIIHELITTNTFISDIRNNLDEMNFNGLVIGSFTITIILLLTLATLLMVKFDRNRYLLAFSLLLIILSNALVFWIPFKAVRFVIGLITFASSMSVTGRILARMQSDESNNKSIKKYSFHLLQTFTLDLYGRLAKLQAFPYPSIGFISYFGIVCFFLDTSIFIIKEWTPYHISQPNQYFAISIIGGIWVLLSMDWNYLISIVQFAMIGTEFPLELKHHHPLLSTSISEFWGIRWNPIVCKLLQECFYKPCRRLGCSRSLSVIACFTGSALLHAIPQYASTNDMKDSIMIFSFFFLQSFVLFLEMTFFHYQDDIHLQKKKILIHRAINSHDNLVDAGNPVPHTPQPATTIETTHQQNEKKIKFIKNIKYQWLAESSIIFFVLQLLFRFLENNHNNFQNILSLLLFSIAITSFAYIRWKIYNYEIENNIIIKQSKNVWIHFLGKYFIRSLIGWSWTLFVIITLLPLFSIPVLHAFDQVFAKSFVIGPVIRVMTSLLFSCE
eukprot:gene8009-10853_t